MKTTVSISLLTLIVFLGLSPDIARAQDSSSPTVLHACYVPAAGIVYRIKGPGLADECRSPRHVEFSWTDGVPDQDHGNLDGLSDDDHPEYVREGEAAAGDLTGDYPDPEVSGLRGHPLSDATPSSGQVLSWDGAAWSPADRASSHDHAGRIISREIKTTVVETPSGGRSGSPDPFHAEVSCDSGDILVGGGAQLIAAGGLETEFDNGVNDILGITLIANGPKNAFPGDTWHAAAIDERDHSTAYGNSHLVVYAICLGLS